VEWSEGAKDLAVTNSPAVASQIHPDWRKHEAASGDARYRLLALYRGQWVAFADEVVIAAAATPLEVFLAIRQSAQDPFVIRSVS